MQMPHNMKAVPAIALTLATTAMSMPRPAYANIVTDINEARETCDQLYAEAEVANEELNGTQARLDELNAQIAEIEAGIQDDKILLVSQMRMSYKSGMMNGWTALMQADTIEDMIATAEYSAKVQAENRSNIRSVMDATRELHETQAQVSALRDEQSARKADLDAKVQAANDYMAGLTQDLRNQLGVDSLSASWDVPAEISSGTGEAWRDVVLTAAYANLGGAYIYGGSSLRAADCSGLTMWCYAQAGINISHYSEAQATFCTKPISQAVPGDIVWRYGHVGIYIGDGITIEAHTPARGISYGKLSSFAACGSPI